MEVPTDLEKTVLSPEQSALEIEWSESHHSTFHYIWLRDNCSQSRNDNGQRLIEIADIPPDIRPSSTKLIEHRKIEDSKIEITWTDGQISHYPVSWLIEHCYSTTKQISITKKKIRNQKTLKLWDSELMKTLPRVYYEDIYANDEALKNWLEMTKDYGFAILHGVPSELDFLENVVKLFGDIWETNYGSIFDVRTVAKPNNLAYTNLALSLHTDNPYKENVPSLQLLHCLSSSVNGGDSILADGLYIAETLHEKEREKFELLSTVPISFRWYDEKNNQTAKKPVIKLDNEGKIEAIHFNNRAAAPFNLPRDLMESYYDAYRTFAQMLENPKYHIRFRMGPGDLFIVDNLRVLHGRTKFDCAGIRHLRGCYADRDDLHNKIRTLEKGQ